MTTTPHPDGTVRLDENDVQIVVTGHVTVHNAHDLKQGILDALGRIRHLDNLPGPIVNLSNVGTIGSSGIAALVSGARHCISAGKELFILGATPEFREALTMVSEHGLFVFMEDLPR